MRWKGQRNSQCPHHLYAPTAHVIMTKPFRQITVKQAVVLLIGYYGDNAGGEASRRASYARIAGRQDECRFWEEVLQVLEPVSQAPQIH